MPREASPKEIFRYYEVRKVASDEARGAARVNMEGKPVTLVAMLVRGIEYAEARPNVGDVTLSAEDMSVARAAQQHSPNTATDTPLEDILDLYNGDEEEEEAEFEEEDHHSWFEGSTAVKFLAAGGIAGAGELSVFRCRQHLLTLVPVSRTCTAPFDRLKIFLITRPPDLGGVSLSSKAPIRGVRAIGSAVARIYSEGGVRAFWTGNGLSVAKILPESAIKFLAYESSVRCIASTRASCANQQLSV